MQSLPYSFPLIAALLIGTVQLPANEVRNGGFSNGFQGWIIQRANESSLTGSTADSHAKFQDDGALIDVRSFSVIGDKPNDVRLLQFLPSLEQGSDYTLSFEAKIPDGETILYALGKPIGSGPNRGNLGGGIPLTEIVGNGEWKPVSVTFTWDATATEIENESNPAPASLQLRIGRASEFGIRNVTLSK